MNRAVAIIILANFCHPCSHNPDAGWCVARCLNDVVEVLGDEQFSEQA
jgi:hypothetical protein